MAEILTNGEVVLTYAELVKRVKELEESLQFKNRMIRDLEDALNETFTARVSMVN